MWENGSHHVRTVVVATVVLSVAIVASGLAADQREAGLATRSASEDAGGRHSLNHRARPNPRIPNTIGFWDGDRGLTGTGDLFNRSRGLISLTTDGGRTFEVVAHTNAGVAWIDTAGTQDAWVALQGPRRSKQLLHSGDGGQTWERLSSDPPWAPSFATPTDGIALAAPDQDYGGAAIESKRVVITHDGGASWELVATPCPARRYVGAAVAMGTSIDAWAVCVEEGYTGMEPKAVFRTGDGGESWKKLVDTSSCRKRTGICTLGFTKAVSFDDEGDGALVVDGPTYLTADRGQSWKQHKIGRGLHSIGAIAVQPLSSRTIVGLVGGYGTSQLVATHDGGSHWQVRHKWPWRIGRG